MVLIHIIPQSYKPVLHLANQDIIRVVKLVWHVILNVWLVQGQVQAIVLVVLQQELIYITHLLYLHVLQPANQDIMPVTIIVWNVIQNVRLVQGQVQFALVA